MPNIKSRARANARRLSRTRARRRSWSPRTHVNRHNYNTRANKKAGLKLTDEIKNMVDSIHAVEKILQDFIQLDKLSSHKIKKETCSRRGQNGGVGKITHTMQNPFGFLKGGSNKAKGRNGKSRTLADLIKGNGDENVINLMVEDFTGDKMKQLGLPAKESQPGPQEGEKPECPKLECPICYDDYKQIQTNNRQLMSTLCGHVFCDVCIKAAIASKKKCPTCQERLTKRNIHPLFL
ncbi:E3 ubiquitin-protein ligase RNF4 [Biomphalaria pfeifferi]|uniref:E3 ubiquitin-protein ligase RNF4 n=1 Tax=Biomphalaria pfeifferi TaxID=112525 RepID=A0AAD8AQ30_BIOPF|nr:E3 ubiquitin-protein ligase RNF4 [Biomphalaria pfeifferi]